MLEHQPQLDEVVECGKEQENLASATASDLGYPSLQQRYEELKVNATHPLTDLNNMHTSALIFSSCESASSLSSNMSVCTKHFRYHVVSV